MEVSSNYPLETFLLWPFCGKINTRKKWIWSKCMATPDNLLTMKQKSIRLIHRHKNQHRGLNGTSLPERSIFSKKEVHTKGGKISMKKKIMLNLVAICAMGLVGCNSNSTSKPASSTYEIAVVTDVGQLKDGSFNEGTYNGAVDFATKNNKTYKYFQPANGSEANDNDRVAAMESAIKAGAKVIVAPGFLQATAMTEVASANPDVKFVFVDGWALSDSDNKVLNNVTAITYKEQESGYFAGYAAVKDGYTKLGATLGGGGSNPACNRYGYGYVQGINAAAKEMNKNVEVKVSYKYGSSFKAGPELKTQISTWYESGTEIVFACGGSMVTSVITAAKEHTGAKIIGVDVDQNNLYPEGIVTSAQKSLAVSVSMVLDQLYNKNEWDSKLGGKAQNLGAKEDATGLPTADASWKFKTFTKEEYNTLFNQVKNGTLVPASDVAEDCNDQAFWTGKAFSNVTVTLDK